MKKVSCAECGIAKKHEDGKVRCLKFNSLLFVGGIDDTSKECHYFTPFMEEDGELMTPEEHLMLKEVEMQARSFKGPI